MSRSSTKALPPLEALGLTPLEAEVYRFLVAESPASGYRIAQGLGKPVGNIYKSIEALEDKGAIVTALDEGGRVARAVPIKEFCEVVARRFDAARREAESELRELHEPVDDDLLYRIDDLDTFVARCRAMIRSAKMFIIASITPALLEPLAAELERCQRRGVRVVIKSFAPAEISGATLVADPRGIDAVTNGPGQWLTISIDGREAVCALTNHEGDELHMGLWTQNPLLAWCLYTGTYGDAVLASVRGIIAAGGGRDDVIKDFQRFTGVETPASAGKMSLARRFRAAGRPKRVTSSKE